MEELNILKDIKITQQLESIIILENTFFAKEYTLIRFLGI